MAFPPSTRSPSSFPSTPNPFCLMSSATPLFQDAKPSRATMSLVPSTILPTTATRHTSTNNTNSGTYGHSLYSRIPTTPALLPLADFCHPFTRTCLPFNDGLVFSPATGGGGKSKITGDMSGFGFDGLKLAMDSLDLNSSPGHAKGTVKLEEMWKCTSPCSTRNVIQDPYCVACLAPRFKTTSNNSPTPPRSASSTTTSFTWNPPSPSAATAASSFLPGSSKYGFSSMELEQQQLAQQKHRGMMEPSSLGPRFHFNNPNGNIPRNVFATDLKSHSEHVDHQSMYLPRTVPRHQNYNNAVFDKKQTVYSTPTMMTSPNIVASVAGSGRASRGSICAENGWVFGSNGRQGQDAVDGGDVRADCALRDLTGQNDRQLTTSFNMNACRQAPIIANSDNINLFMAAAQRQVRPAQTYSHFPGHVGPFAIPRNISNNPTTIRTYILIPPTDDPSWYPTPPNGIFGLIPQGAFLAPSGQRISTSGRVVNVSGDDTNAIKMFWPDNEPLPHNNQCKPSPQQHIVRMTSLNRLEFNCATEAFWELPPPPTHVGTPRNHQQRPHFLISVAHYLEVASNDLKRTLPPPEVMARVLPAIKNTGNQGPMERQAFDWECGECQYVNWRRRLVCQLCYPYAPGNTPPATYAERMWSIVRIAAGNAVRGTPIPATHRDFRIGEGRINPVAAGRKLQLEQQQQMARELETLTLLLNQYQQRPPATARFPAFHLAQPSYELAQPMVSSSSPSPFGTVTDTLTSLGAVDGSKVWGGRGVGNGIMTLTPPGHSSGSSPAASTNSPDWSKIGVITTLTPHIRVSSSASSTSTSSGSSSGSPSVALSSVSSSGPAFALAPGASVLNRIARVGDVGAGGIDYPRDFS
ncbi:hypothetical protein FRB94_001238 [Tulasnella sp. JGI-2019a]|nr:hypothetical protein FRB94_001238 [Tulasnella sp. JGI-2019a]